MRAARFFGPRDLRVETIPNLTCGTDDVIVRVAANAVCGTDVKTFLSGHSLIKQYPVITGHELAGTIIEVGRNVRRFTVRTMEGDEERRYEEGMGVVVAPVVACERCGNCERGLFEACTNREDVGFKYDGGNAQLMRVPGELMRKQIPPVFPVPEGVPLWAAAICEPIACAIHAQLKLHRFGNWDKKAQSYGSTTGIKRGDVVVVIGGGPLGDVHCELARAAGATVILAQRSAEKLELAKWLGIADHYVLNAHGALEKLISDMTGGDGVDIVITACPDPGAQVQAVNICRRGGCISLFGSIPKGASGEATVPMPTNVIHNNGPAIYGTSGASPYHLPLALHLIAQGKITPENYVSHVFPLDKLETVLRIRGIADRAEYDRTLQERGGNYFDFLEDTAYGVADVSDPYQRVLKFKGEIMKALCLPGLPAGQPIVSLSALSPAARRARLAAVTQ
jgi:L-iditol 2-dehydrogenase